MEGDEKEVVVQVAVHVPRPTDIAVEFVDDARPEAVDEGSDLDPAELNMVSPERSKLKNGAPPIDYLATRMALWIRLVVTATTHRAHSTLSVPPSVRVTAVSKAER